MSKNKLYNNPDISVSFSWSDSHFTDIGKRRKVNEDDLMANPEQAHWAVADGMGGHDAGDVASQTIVDALEPLKQTQVFEDFVDTIDNCLCVVNEQLQLLAGGDRLIGSTVAGLALQQQHVLYYWVGDSRVYRLRDQKLAQLSVDHTYTQELVAQGKLTAEAAKNHPDKSVITRAVGAEKQLVVDFKRASLQHLDLFFICSDGVDKEMTDDEVEAVLNQHRGDIELAGQTILDTVLERGARDNVTFILVALQQQQ